MWRGRVSTGVSEITVLSCPFLEGALPNTSAFPCYPLPWLLSVAGKVEAQI